MNYPQNNLERGFFVCKKDIIKVMKLEYELGKGALPSKRDLRDTKWNKIAMASIPFNWSLGFDIESLTGKLPIKDQGTSNSCGGQSGAYLSQALSILRIKNNNAEQSARYIYSQIWYQPNGGTSMRDIFNLLIKKGSCLEVLVSSYPTVGKVTEPFMRDKSENTASADASAQVFKAERYAFVNTDIDSVAQAIRDNGGVIIELEGINNGTWLSEFPIAPNLAPEDKRLWRHFVYGGKAKLINGKKHIGIANSWGKDAGDAGWQWLSEDYFTSGHIARVGTIYEPASPTIAEQKKNIITTLLALFQKLSNVLFGDTKLIIS